MLSVFQFEISGKERREEHPLNKLLKSIIFSNFHLDISGKPYISILVYIKILML